MFVNATYYREKKTVHYFDEHGEETLYIGGSFVFNPVSKKMVAKFLDHCVLQWLGQPDESEKELLDQQQRASYPTTVDTCKGAKWAKATLPKNHLA